ncbi:caspase domain-containing protein [Streptomyces sp. NPDC059979]|uniref:caspase family protein n=1 Tax=Streptomyces sp. NPDC059979 TaxID=3347021 RepID=UPI0036978B32
MSEPRRFALVVANSTYDDPGLHALQAPYKDAEALRDVLGDAEIGDFQVDVLTDPTCHELRVKVDDFFAERTARDALLLHFSGHGVKNAAGKLFLATKDTRRHRLPSTAVSAGYVSDLMLETRAGWVVVFLDCCYAGAFERGLFTRADADAHVHESFRELDGHRGRGVFTASTAVQYVYDGDRPVPGVPGEMPEVGEPASASGPSPFTRAVVEGMLTGEADRDGDGEIGLSELSDYVRIQLRESTKYQTPQLWLFGADGRDFPIAHAGQQAPRPKPLPDDVYDAVHSSRRDDRLWAVGKLETLLCGHDVGLALTATTTLTELKEDDSRRVADGASEALLTALPRTVESACHLGPVVVGTPCTPKAVRVEGPPIVRRTMRAQSSEPWLRARCLRSRVEVSAQVSEPRHYEGSLLLAAATGDVPVTVDVDGVPAEPKQQTATTATATVDDPVSRAPSVARTVGPFLLAMGLLVIAGLTPLMTSAKGAKPYEISERWAWSGHHEEVWWVLLIGLIANGALAVLALQRAPHVRRPPVFWCYLVVTLLTTVSLILVFCLNVFQPPDASDPSYDYAPFVGGWALLAACLVQAWGCVVLWRHRATGPR